MPKIRTIKPEFWSSPDVAAASLRQRLLYIAMWNWANDYGIGDANPRSLIGFAFPNDENYSPPELRRDLGGLRQIFGTIFFEYKKREFYVIPEWFSHQKIDKRSQIDEGLWKTAQAAIEASSACGKAEKSPENQARPNFAENTAEPARTTAEPAGNRALEKEKEREKEIYIGGGGSKLLNAREEQTPATTTTEITVPSRHCEDHPNDTDVFCGKCQRARLYLEEWEAKRAAERAEPVTTATAPAQQELKKHKHALDTNGKCTWCCLGHQKHSFGNDQRCRHCNIHKSQFSETEVNQ